MNERIKLLAELSKTPKTMMVDGVLQSVVTIDAERFAELIIAECIAAHEDDYGADIIGDVLKKHFGIEE